FTRPQCHPLKSSKLLLRSSSFGARRITNVELDNFLSVAGAGVRNKRRCARRLARAELDRPKGERSVCEPKAKGEKRIASQITVAGHPWFPCAISIVVERQLADIEREGHVESTSRSRIAEQEIRYRVPRLNSRMPGDQQGVCLIENSP